MPALADVPLWFACELAKVSAHLALVAPSIIADVLCALDVSARVKILGCAHVRGWEWEFARSSFVHRVLMFENYGALDLTEPCAMHCDR